MNYPMFVCVNLETNIIIYNYREASIVAKMAKPTGLTHTDFLDIRCRKTGGYMGRVCTETFNVYNARDEMVFPVEEDNNGTEPLSNIERRPLSY